MTLIKKPGITLMHSFAHVRPKFSESLDSDGPRAKYVLEKMQLLYSIERHQSHTNPRSYFLIYQHTQKEVGKLFWYNFILLRM